MENPIPAEPTESPLIQRLKSVHPALWISLGAVALLGVIAVVYFALVNKQPGGATVEVDNPAPIAVHSVAQDYIVVKFKAGTPTSTIERIMKENNLTYKGQIEGIGSTMLNIDMAKDTVEEVTQRIKMKEAANLDYAETDEVASPDMVPNDTNYSKQWHLKKISAPAAWDMTHGSSSVIIAILDTGVKSTHEDLASKLVAGWNTYDNNANTEDVYGHGTAVAGAAAAITNNALGIASPGFDAKIMPMRISDLSGLGYGSAIASALIWSANHGARVANISYRMDYSSTVTAAAQYFMSKGGVVTMSAGNESKYFSAATDNPYVLTIGATASDDSLASWSNSGGNVDLVAPGSGIYTANRSSTLPYSSWSGTSFSAPITAGVAALVIAAAPWLNADEIQTVLKQSADDLGAAGYDTTFGWGRLNAEKAVRLANPALIKTTTTVDTVNPSVSLTSPADGATVSGTVNVTMTASDNVAVKKILLYVDGKNVGLSSVAPYAIAWDTTATSTGAHKIYAKAYDAANNAGVSKTITVNTVASTTVSLEISGFAVTSKTTSTATLAWTTNIASTGSVNYGATGAMGSSAISGKSAVAHELVLSGLNPDTEYSFEIAAVAGNQTAKTAVSTFKTAAIEIVIPDKITMTSFSVSAKTANSATIDWETNIESIGSINYGLTANMGTILKDTVSSTKHSLNMVGLAASTTYYFQVTYQAGSQILKSEQSSFITDKLTSTSTVIDKIRPAITLIGGSSLTINVFDAYTEFGATAVDNIDGDITSRIDVSGEVDTSVVGTYLVKYNVADNAGNAAYQKVRTVKVVDKTKPVITLNGLQYMNIPVFGTYTEQGATAVDNYSGDLTPAIVVAGSAEVNTSIVGTYYVTYTAVDSSGNTTIVKRTVRVIDSVKPVITLIGTSLVTAPINSLYIDLGATAQDNYDGDLTEKITASSTVNTAALGTYYVTYSVIDSSNNKAVSVKRTVKVISQ